MFKIYALGSALFAGLVVVFAKLGVANISSNMATWIRTIVIIAFLSVLVLVRGEWSNPFLLSKKSLLFLTLSALATGFSWICYFKALQTGPAAVVAPIDKLSLLFAVVLAVVFLHEHLNAWQWGGVALMVAGALLVIVQ